MWKGIRLLLLSVLFLLYAPPCFAAPASAPAPAEETVIMSKIQWAALKQIIEEQDELLTTLQSLSSEDNETLMKLMTDLKRARQSLTRSEAELSNARQSLTLANRTLQEQNESLAKLSAQIKKERAISNRRQWQHTFWGFLIGTAIGAVAAH